MTGAGRGRSLSALRLTASVYRAYRPQPPLARVRGRGDGARRARLSPTAAQEVKATERTEAKRRIPIAKPRTMAQASHSRACRAVPTCADCLSAVEHHPADAISQPLIVQDELADRPRQLLTLPSALQPASTFALSFRRSGSHGFDRVGCRTEFVSGDVRHRRRLTGCVCGLASGPAHLSGGRVGRESRRAGLRHRDFAAHPRPSLLDRLAGPRVRRPGRLEEMQNMLRACCRPQGKKPVVRIRERAATADRDEARVTVFGKDHSCT